MKKAYLMLSALSFLIAVTACNKKDDPVAPTAPAVPVSTATPTDTPTAVFTPTRTSTFTNTHTMTATRTNTITNTPTITLSPTTTPYPTCSSAPVSLGYSVLGSAFPILSNEKTVLASPITLAAPVTVRWVNFYKFYTGTGRTKVAIYNAAANSILVQSTYTLAVGTAAGWYQIQVPQTVLPAATYWIATWSEVTSGSYGHYQDGDTDHRKLKLVNQDDFPASMNTNLYAYQGMCYTLEYCP